MSIISKYLSREIARYFLIVLTVVVGIYGVVDFLEKIDDFMEAGLPFTKALSFLIFKIPFIVAQITPVGILLSVLIVLGLMSKYNEIVALRSSGMSVYHLLKPVLSIGVILSCLLFFISEILVPITMDKANRIWLKEVRGETAVASREKNVWIKGDHLISHVSFYNHRTQTLFGITLNYFDGDFHLSKRIDASKGMFQGGQWVLEDAMVQQLKPGDETYSVTLHERWVAGLDLLPDDLKRVVKKSEEMGFAELYDYIAKVESEGYDASLYRVDLHAKIAFPLVCIILVMIGTGIAIRGKLKDGLPVSISYGIGVAFLYHVFHSFCISLGYADVLPPIVAAWSANSIFFCFGSFILLNAE